MNTINAEVICNKLNNAYPTHIQSAIENAKTAFCGNNPKNIYALYDLTHEAKAGIKNFESQNQSFFMKYSNSFLTQAIIALLSGTILAKRIAKALKIHYKNMTVAGIIVLLLSGLAFIQSFKDEKKLYKEHPEYDNMRNLYSSLKQYLTLKS